MTKKLIGNVALITGDPNLGERQKVGGLVFATIGRGIRSMPLWQLTLALGWPPRMLKACWPSCEPAELSRRVAWPNWQFSNIGRPPSQRWLKPSRTSMASESHSLSSHNGEGCFRADALLPPTVDFEPLRRYTSAKLAIANWRRQGRKVY